MPVIEARTMPTDCMISALACSRDPAARLRAGGDAGVLGAELALSLAHVPEQADLLRHAVRELADVARHVGNRWATPVAWAA